MPHIIVEHTEDIGNIIDIVTDSHHSLCGQETVTSSAVKSRSVAVQNTFVGEIQNGSMVHMTLKLLSGRSDELRAKMTRDLFDVVKSKVADTVSVTVESVELHDNSYQK
jgi:5-carboxymethyl-2-hydroxymuconate isomerase